MKVSSSSEIRNIQKEEEGALQVQFQVEVEVWEKEPFLAQVQVRLFSPERLAY